MSEAVGDVCYEIHVLALGASEQPVHRVDDHLYDVDVLPFVETSDVVGFGHSPAMKNQINRPRMVLDEEPVTHIFSLSVDRERPAVTYVVDEQGYEFLRKLIGTIVVRAVGNDRRHTIGVVERAYEMV